MFAINGFLRPLIESARAPSQHLVNSSLAAAVIERRGRSDQDAPPRRQSGIASHSRAIRVFDFSTTLQLVIRRAKDWLLSGDYRIPWGPQRTFFAMAACVLSADRRTRARLALACAANQQRMAHCRCSKTEQQAGTELSPTGAAGETSSAKS